MCQRRHPHRCWFPRPSGLRRAPGAGQCGKAWWGPTPPPPRFQFRRPQGLGSSQAPLARWETPYCTTSGKSARKPLDGDGMVGGRSGQAMHGQGVLFVHRCRCLISLQLFLGVVRREANPNAGRGRPATAVHERLWPAEEGRLERQHHHQVGRRVDAPPSDPRRPERPEAVGGGGVSDGLGKASEKGRRGWAGSGGPRTKMAFRWRRVGGGGHTDCAPT